MNTALLLIDIQNDYFPGGRMELTGANEAGKAAGRLLAARPGDLRPAAGRRAWRLAVMAAGSRGQCRETGETLLRASPSRLSLPGLESDCLA